MPKTQVLAFSEQVFIHGAPSTIHLNLSNNHSYFKEEAFHLVEFTNNLFSEYFIIPEIDFNIYNKT